LPEINVLCDAVVQALAGWTPTGAFDALGLSRISGRFIMSLNDRLEVRETFKRFDIEAVKTTYTIGAKAAKKVGELIISN